jgi:hypothetical protein
VQQIGFTFDFNHPTEKSWLQMNRALRSLKSSRG